MTPDEFIRKWKASTLTERSASHSHFLDLCTLLDEATPTDSDQVGDSYTFEKGATKTTGGKGWADVWKRGCFAWEYKGKHKNLTTAFAQLQQYAPVLESPPLLVVSDMETIEVHTNWTNTVAKVHRFGIEDLSDADQRAALRWVFSDPEKLKPGQTRQALTEDVAQQFARLAMRLQSRGHGPQEVAHFVNRLVFCMFAEDVDLLPNSLFKRLLQHCSQRPDLFASMAGQLFSAMRTGGFVGFEQVFWFNGGLFDSDDALPLDKEDVKQILAAATLDWGQIDPSILGTLFERGLDPDKRGQLGAHYTDTKTIVRLIDPVITLPLTREWEVVRSEAEARIAGAKPASRTRARNEAERLCISFLERLRRFRVLDPACGSGNFLYLALIALKTLEHRVNLDIEAMGFTRQFPTVGPEAVLGIEINPYAAELARVSVWIGEIQWMRRNGFTVSPNPILKPLQNIECRDAILTPASDEAAWPDVNAIIGNPPFLGSKWMLDTLGADYTGVIRSVYKGRVPVTSDLVTYWFEKARSAIALGKAQAAGLVATNMIRGASNREILDRICTTTPIFRAWSDEPWSIDGADVRVSLVCFSKDAALSPILNDHPVSRIHADLTASPADTTTALPIPANAGMAIRGIELGGPFGIPGTVARQWLAAPLNPNGRPNADVLRPSVAGKEFAGRPADKWIIDFSGLSESEAAFFEPVFHYAERTIKPARSANNEARTARNWWLHRRSGADLRQATKNLDRFIGTPLVSKHRIFNWISRGVVPDTRIVVIPRDDDVMFGILSSCFHEKWTLQNCQYHGVGNDPVYTPSSVFYTFPFPEGLSPDTPASAFHLNPHASRIALAARELTSKRELWLNPPNLIIRVAEATAGLPERVLAKNADAAKLLKTRTLTNLYNLRPTWLAALHQELDEAVTAAYGWSPDLSDDEILTRLLSLNFARAAEQTTRTLSPPTRA